ncbi:unnamed protein product [Gongylonema pulchrum]|uniref:Uncharacterized protein n=1 Tax=Gongylonema pulchrum TaxID=637853 RepID=A0A183E7N5_9BILA|nr:unnamed protein product [Gongylonema pulchrum]
MKISVLLRICSAHFEGGEKKEGDIPVPDPQLDAPISIELPPKETKSSDRRRAALQQQQQSRTTAPTTPSPSNVTGSTSVKRSRSLAVSADYLTSWRSRSAAAAVAAEGSHPHFCVVFATLAAAAAADVHPQRSAAIPSKSAACALSQTMPICLLYPCSETLAKFLYALQVSLVPWAQVQRLPSSDSLRKIESLSAAPIIIIVRMAIYLGKLLHFSSFPPVMRFRSYGSYHH